MWIIKTWRRIDTSTCKVPGQVPQDSSISQLQGSQSYVLSGQSVSQNAEQVRINGVNYMGKYKNGAWCCSKQKQI